VQLHQLSGQYVQAYIDIFCKLRVHLYVLEPEEVLVVKFNSVFLSFLCKEVQLFDNTSLNKAFLWALAVERKVVIKPHNSPSPRPTANPSTATRMPGSPWCTFHRCSTHSTTDCRALKSSHTRKALYLETASPFVLTPATTDHISLPNLTEPNPTLLLMTSTLSVSTPPRLFTHNCQIKHIIATLVLNNGIQNNLVAQALVDRL